jgi:hypothetical protein
MRGNVRREEVVEAGAGSSSGEDATDIWWSFIASHGVRREQIRALATQLESDFRADAGGYATLRDIPMPQRAIVSDQILGAAQAIARNLIEARLSEEDVAALLADGERLHDPTIASQESDTRRDIAYVGFFRAIGSALDNSAAVAIGVLRLPVSIRRASFATILGLKEATVARQAPWEEFRALVSQHADDPAGWLPWTMEMRHALMHRPRLLALGLPRPTPGLPLIVPDYVRRHVMRERLRWDPHFRRRPWLPDMQHLADQNVGNLTDVVLGETAVQTARGVFERANALLEGVSEFLLKSWTDPRVTAVAPPTDKWKLEEPLDIEFAGFAPGNFPADLAAAVISPHDEERVKLAAQLHNAAPEA